MAKTRLMGQSQKTSIEWDRLLRQAIERAERRNDNRIQALRTALSMGQAATVLKRLGIIGENDLLREFPSDPST